jgi:hypothetical protein
MSSARHIAGGLVEVVERLETKQLLDFATTFAFAE